MADNGGQHAVHVRPNGHAVKRSYERVAIPLPLARVKANGQKRSSDEQDRHVRSLEGINGAAGTVKLDDAGSKTKPAQPESSEAASPSKVYTPDSSGSEMAPVVNQPLRSHNAEEGEQRIQRTFEHQAQLTVEATRPFDTSKPQLVFQVDQDTAQPLDQQRISRVPTSKPEHAVITSQDAQSYSQASKRAPLMFAIEQTKEDRQFAADISSLPISTSRSSFALKPQGSSLIDNQHNHDLHREMESASSNGTLLRPQNSEHVDARDKHGGTLRSSLAGTRSEHQSIPNGNMHTPLPHSGANVRASTQLEPMMRAFDGMSASYNQASLVMHIVQSLVSPHSYPDVQVHVYDKHGGELERPCHRMLLARSHRLARDLSIRASRDVFRIDLPGQWMSVQGFLGILEWMYGRETPYAAMEASGNGRLDAEILLAMISIARHFEMDAAAVEAVSLLSSILQWESIVLTLHYAIQGGLDVRMDWSAYLRTSLQPEMVPESAPGKSTDAARLLHASLHFLVHQFPRDFYPDLQAADLPFMKRLPQSPGADDTSVLDSGDVDITANHRPHRSVTELRLSRIQFGEASPREETDLRPSRVTTMLSSILFSLPRGVLKLLLEHPVLSQRLGAETVASVTRQIIAEREARRAQALLYIRLREPADDHDTNYSIQNAFWEERLETEVSAPAGLRLVGYRLPI